MKTMMARSLCFCLLVSSLPASAVSNDSNEQSIPVVGVNDDGTPVEVPVKVPFFKRGLKKALRGMQGTMLPALNQQIPSDQPWYLDKMEVGVGLAASIGLGDVTKAKVEPTLLFIYKNLQAKKDNGRGE